MSQYAQQWQKHEYDANARTHAITRMDESIIPLVSNRVGAGWAQRVGLVSRLGTRYVNPTPHVIGRTLAHLNGHGHLPARPVNQVYIKSVPEVQPSSASN